jgi:hypothetical protein
MVPAEDVHEPWQPGVDVLALSPNFDITDDLVMVIIPYRLVTPGGEYSFLTDTRDSVSIVDGAIYKLLYGY